LSFPIKQSLFQAKFKIVLEQTVVSTLPLKVRRQGVWDGNLRSARRRLRY